MGESEEREGESEEREGEWESRRKGGEGGEQEEGGLGRGWEDSHYNFSLPLAVQSSDVSVPESSGQQMADQRRK